jgi:hypothetical protein
VFFTDRGGVLDAPIDDVWDYILHDEEFHPQAHRGSLRKLKLKKLSEVSDLVSCEVFRGRWTKMTSRLTTIPPLARIHEELKGPYAGTKMIFLYTPKGKRTGIDVFGLVPKDLEKENRRTLAKAHQEDAPMVRAFAKKRRRR